jgi:hypothetical protein
MQLNCSVCCLNFSPEDVVTQSTKKYIDSESLKLESFSGVLFSTPKSSIRELITRYLHKGPFKLSNFATNHDAVIQPELPDVQLSHNWFGNPLTVYN